MAITAVCPACQAAFSLADQHLGRKVRCTRCQTIFRAAGVPAARTGIRPAAPAAYPPPPRSSGMTGPIIAGSIVAAVFAFILVGGIALVLYLRPGRTPAPPAPAGPVVQHLKATARTPEPPPAPAPTVRETPPAPMPTPAVGPPPPPANGDGSLARDVIDRVKRATVYLRVTIEAGNVAQGSGFFAVEPGVVLTNAHVLGMLVGKTRKPQRVEVVLNSGQGDERTLQAQILEVDRASDLAVLRVTGPNLPAPLAVHVAGGLQETQQVYVCGFPFGVNLGREVSLRKSSVAALRKENDVLARVQLEGGMDPGNSGGPVIDSKGQVVGVAVAGIRGTTINFAIPGEKVHNILNGRITRMTLGQPYRDGAQTRLPVTLRLADPLGRVRQVALDVWSGAPGAPRPAPPAPLATDSPRQQTALAYANGSASGDVVLPALPAGRTYWLQASARGGQMQHSPALNFPSMPPPLERTATTLATGYKAGTGQPLELSCVTTLRMDVGGGDHTLVIDLDGALTEVTRAVDARGTAAVRLDYRKLTMGISFDGKPSARMEAIQQALAQVGQLSGDLRVDRQGNVVQNRLDLARVPAGVRAALTNVGDQAQQALEALTVPLPGGPVEPGQSWTAARALPIDVAGRYDNGTMEVTYTYLGLRTRNGRAEAVLALSGAVRARPGVAQYINGRAAGTAVVDVATGIVTTALASVDVDLDLTVNGKPSRADGTLELKVQRAVAR